MLPMNIPLMVKGWFQSLPLKLESIMLLYLFLTVLLFLVFYYGIEFLSQRRMKVSWLRNNQGLLRQYQILSYLLELLGHRLSVCKKCKNDRMQLWNYKSDQLLVVRCKSCKMNYTLTPDHSAVIGLILSELDVAIKLLDAILSNQQNVLGKFLIRKLSLEPSALKSDVSTLGVFQFFARKSYDDDGQSIFDMVMTEEEYDSPNRVHLQICTRETNSSLSTQEFRFT